MQLAEVQKESLQVLIGDPTARVSKSHLKADLLLFKMRWACEVVVVLMRLQLVFLGDNRWLAMDRIVIYFFIWCGA